MTPTEPTEARNACWDTTENIGVDPIVLEQIPTPTDNTPTIVGERYVVFIGGQRYELEPGSLITLANEGYTINGGEMIKSPEWRSAKITPEEHAEFGYTVKVSGTTEEPT